MPQNKILTSTNTALTVTNLAAAGGTGQASGTSTMEGVPIGTGNGLGTGELAVKVTTVGSGGSGTAAQRVQGADVVTTVATSDPVQIGGMLASDGTVTRITVTAAGAIVNSPTPAVAAALANVNDSASSVTVAAANAARRGLLVFNDSDQILYLKFGATASTTSYTVQIAAGGYYEAPAPVYVGIVDGIWAANSTGAVRVTELT